MKALVIVDMLDDFVTGALANPHAERIVEPLARLLEHARRDDDWVVVFSNDAHHPADPELRVWGEHAMAGTPGAQVIAELEPQPGPSARSSRRSAPTAPSTAPASTSSCARSESTRSSIAGQHTHICVRHSSYGALIRGYRVTVPRDAVCAFEGVDAEEALDYLVMAYGATVTDVAALTGAPASV